MMPPTRPSLSPRIERYLVQHHPDRFGEIVAIFQCLTLPFLEDDPVGRERVHAAMLAFSRRRG